jgi:arsenate reductase (thioredoxin)
MRKILFVCVENAGRSLMAEAFANKYGKDKFIVSSAGNKLSEKVNPTVVEVLKEKGIDISMNKPKMLNPCSIVYILGPHEYDDASTNRRG